jgi:hypothetical protein
MSATLAELLAGPVLWNRFQEITGSDRELSERVIANLNRSNKDISATEGERIALLPRDNESLRREK